MFILIYIILGYLLITTAILIRNKKNFKPLQSITKTYFDDRAPEVSICIPARNEANSIERCIRSAVKQKYPNFKVYVLNDNSTDDTGKILAQLSKTYPQKLSVISGNPKPADWLGKSWACHQLSEISTGDFIIFLDADTWIQPEATARLLRTIGQDVIDFATIWPQQELGTFWEKMAIPIIYFSLFTLLPIHYVHRIPKWLPSFLRKKADPFFAAACGQCMAFRRIAYENIGGHTSVKDRILEDVELAKKIKRSGYSMNMYHGDQAISCRMYHSNRELWEGFRKNFLAGFSGNVFLFIGMGILQFMTFILPVLALPFLMLFKGGAMLFVTFLFITLMLVQRVIINLWFNWSWIYGILHPIGVLWFQLLAIQVLSDHFKNTSVQWKNRSV